VSAVGPSSGRHPAPIRRGPPPMGADVFLAPRRHGVDVYLQGHVWERRMPPGSAPKSSSAWPPPGIRDPDGHLGCCRRGVLIHRRNIAQEERRRARVADNMVSPEIRARILGEIDNRIIKLKQLLALDRQHISDYRRVRSSRTATASGTVPRFRRLDRRLGCGGRPRAQTSRSSVRSGDSSSDPDEPPPPLGRHPREVVREASAAIGAQTLVVVRVHRGRTR
jgi:hypothetical protein